MTLETSPIVEFTERGLRTADGVEHEVDTVIYGTGFHAADYLCSLDVYGTGGRRLRDDWRDGPEAYLGHDRARLPEPVHALRARTPTASRRSSTSWKRRPSSSAALLDDMAAAGVQAVDVRRDIHDAYNAEIQRAMDGTVWLANCNNYYRHPNGKVVTQFPYSGTRFAEMLAQVELRRIRPEGRDRVSGIHHTAIVTADVEASMRFWCDGLGFTKLFDHTFTGDWPTLFRARPINCGRSSSATRSLPTPASSNWWCSKARSAPLAASPDAPAFGFFLVSLQREVDPTLATLAGLGFDEGVRRIEMPAPGGKKVAMAVITAPDGVRVELIGPPE